MTNIIIVKVVVFIFYAHVTSRGLHDVYKKTIQPTNGYHTTRAAF